MWFKIQAAYSTKRDKQDDDADGFETLVKIGHRTSDAQRPAIFNAFAKPLTNTADTIHGGLSRTATLHVYEIRAWFPARDYNAAPPYPYIDPPSWITEISNHVNSDTVGISQVGNPLTADYWPPFTALAKDFRFNDEPVELYEFEWWEFSGAVICDPDGHEIVLPNRGYTEYVYRDAETGLAIDPWDYDPTLLFGTAPNQQRKHTKTRRNIKTSGEDTAEKSWLDAWGRQVEAPVINTTTIGNGSVNQNGTQLGVAGYSFTTELHQGAGITIVGAGKSGRPLHTRITGVVTEGGELVTIETPARTTALQKPVHLPGVIVTQELLQPLATFFGTVPGML